MATIKVCDEQLTQLVADELKWSIEHANHPLGAIEPELLDALWKVLEYFSIKSEFEDYKEQLQWKHQMENQV